MYYIIDGRRIVKFSEDKDPSLEEYNRLLAKYMDIHIVQSVRHKKMIQKLFVK